MLFMTLYRSPVCEFLLVTPRSALNPWVCTITMLIIVIIIIGAYVFHCDVQQMR